METSAQTALISCQFIGSMYGHCSPPMNKLKMVLQTSECPEAQTKLQYLHAGTNHGTSVSRIHNLGVDQMSVSGSNGGMMQTLQDVICTKPEKGDVFRGSCNYRVLVHLLVYTYLNRS